MLALMGLVAYPGRVRATPHELRRAAICCSLSDRERRRRHRQDVAMIFQDPTTSLNPCFTIGFQLTETLRLHLGLDRKAARKRAVELLEQVGIPAPASRLNDFPHQLSGGMNQRVMIAMAIACNPRLLIADEPTTALDVTIQAQILDLLRGLQRERGMALVLVTHNMGVVAEMARRVAVMYAGQVWRSAPPTRSSPRRSIRTPRAARGDARAAAQASDRLATIPGVVPGLYDRPRGCLFAPRCAYATGRCATSVRRCGRGRTALVRCHYPLGDAGSRRGDSRAIRQAGRGRGMSAPSRMRRQRLTCDAVPVVEARDLRRVYAIRRGLLREPARLQAVGGISFAIDAGRTLAVVGESGCGKSTLARVVALIEQPIGGLRSTLARRRRGATSTPSAARSCARSVQMVFQNPYGSLNPRKKIGAILEAPLAINTDSRAGSARRARAGDAR